MNITLLSGHTSPETAYVVDDYPYGFRLRCKIRYWLEYVEGKGVRFWSQTTNPKKGDIWNKPKASTYALFGGVMFLDEKGHVQWSQLHEYMDTKQAREWFDAYKGHAHPGCLKIAEKFVKAKEDYEAKKLAAQTNNAPAAS